MDIRASINKVQLLNAMFAEITDTASPMTNSDQSSWTVRAGSDTFVWELFEDTDRSVLIAHLDIQQRGIDFLPAEPVDVVTANSAIFSVYPACITKLDDSDCYRISWQHHLSLGLASCDFLRIMSMMREVKKALCLRWSQRTATAQAQAGFKQLH